jgi:hypothetical protein
MIDLAAEIGSADEEPNCDDMIWTEPLYRRESVNAAGRALLAAMYADWNKWGSDEWEEYYAKLNIINNWRASHAYPLLTMRMTLGHYARKVDPAALVAQRIKRLVSIGAKLDHERRMKLTQMQDIGGCRAVVVSMGALNDLVACYEQSRIKHERATYDDYVNKPRDSGYRGVHLVYRYRSDKAKTVYNDLKIEIQLRSQFQHAWATAVETVGTFIGQALKSSIGEAQWLRFFQLMGTAIAIRERTPAVPETPADETRLVEDLAHCATALNVGPRLAAFGHAMRTLTQPSAEQEKAYYYLLRLDANNSQLTVSGFRKNQSEEASEAYLNAEKDVKITPGLDAVLVSVDSIAALERAYPNYFADTRIFVELMNQALSGQETEIDLTPITSIISAPISFC